MGDGVEGDQVIVVLCAPLQKRKPTLDSLVPQRASKQKDTTLRDQDAGRGSLLSIHGAGEEWNMLRDVPPTSIAEATRAKAL